MAEKEKKEQGLQQEELLKLIRAEASKAALDVAGQIAQQISSRVTHLDQLAPAYIAAVRGSRDAVKNATNPHLRNTYADLGSVLDSVRQSFLSNDLWLLQSPGEITVKSDNRPYITMSGVLIHKSGQTIQLKMELPCFTVESKKNGGGEVLNPQTSGSALSYARRYMWAAVAGITQTDDDGDEASYVDGADGPAVTESAGGQDANEEAAMIARIQAAAEKSFDDVKAVRADAQALAKKLGSKKITQAYMDARAKYVQDENKQ